MRKPTQKPSRVGRRGRDKNTGNKQFSERAFDIFDEMAREIDRMQEKGEPKRRPK